mmetsp:Transcript_113949/g.221288  ORF Transcript_113949/g.221288 Transcript_113949/m.221288 type:complete len:297 (+) Transcript_113949:80-970(+)
MSHRSRISRSSTASSRRGTPTQYSWRSGHSRSPAYNLQDGVPFAMEGELDVDHRRLKALGSLASSDLNEDLSNNVRISSHHERQRLPNHLVSELPVNSPPGYSGYTPGVYAGNVFGRTYAIANMHGILHTHAQREQQGLDEPQRFREMTPLRDSSGDRSWRAMEEPFAQKANRIRSELPRRPHSVSGTVSGGHRYPEGAKVPGYAGFVPGVASGNLIAVATPRAARQGFHPDSSKVAGPMSGRRDEAQQNLVVLQSSRVDPSRMPLAGNCAASNYNGQYVQDTHYTQDDLSDSSWL